MRLNHRLLKLTRVYIRAHATNGLSDRGNNLLCLIALCV